jgi:hypothetical protein
LGTRYTVGTHGPAWTGGAHRALVAGEAWRPDGTFRPAGSLLALQDVHILFGIGAGLVGQSHRIKSHSLLDPRLDLGEELGFYHGFIGCDDFELPGEGRVILGNDRDLGNTVAGLDERAEILAVNNDSVCDAAGLVVRVADNPVDDRAVDSGRVAIPVALAVPATEAVGIIRDAVVFLPGLDAATGTAGH